MKNIFKKLIQTLTALAVLNAAGMPAASAKQVSNDRTMAQLNSAHLLNYLTSLEANRALGGVEVIAKRLINRPAENFPVWIGETVTGAILFYEGKSEFKGEPAEKLIDDTGSRFGLKAMEKARSYQSGWQRITLNGIVYEMYCGHQEIFLVCSVIPTPAGDRN